MSEAAFKLGMAQIRVEGGERERNLRRAEESVAEAGRRGCAVVVLPECMDAGWTHPSARALAEPIPGPTSERLSRAARRAGLYVAAGLTERAESALYNAAVLISPDGEILLKHRKINELSIAFDLYSVGDSLGVKRTPLGTFGLNVCADNFPDASALGHSLGRMGAQVLLSPSAWAVDADHDNVAEPYGDLWRRSYSALARCYDMTVVGVSNVGWMTGGPWEGRKCIGCSLAVGPDGGALAEGPYGADAEALIEVTVQPVRRAAAGTEISEALRRKGDAGAG
jgi:predicted amidohydrolase